MNLKLNNSILVNTALANINPKTGYNMKLFKKLPHKNSQNQEIDFGYYIKKITREFNNIREEANFLIKDEMLIIEYKNYKREIAIKGDYYNCQEKLKILNDAKSMEFMKNLIDSMIGIAKEIYQNMDNINFKAGSRIYGSSILYQGIDWDMDEKEFFRKYLGITWK